MAALEIAKGGLTTDPDNHSGEELHTLINLFDQVTIDSTGISLKFDNKSHSWMIDRSIHKKGTRIHLKIKPSSKRTCQKYFKDCSKENKKCSYTSEFIENPQCSNSEFPTAGTKYVKKY